MAFVYKILRKLTLLRRSTTANITVLTRSLRNSSNKNNGDWKKNEKVSGYVCLCCNYPCGGETSSNMYDSRKYSPNLPLNTRTPCFPTIPGFHTGMFRCTDGEVLGPQGQASKLCCYKNPEYFSFHNMTFYDFHLELRPYRKPSPITGRKP